MKDDVIVMEIPLDFAYGAQESRDRAGDQSGRRVPRLRAVQRQRYMRPIALSFRSGQARR
ncbi:MULTISPECIES: hypothetical protein [unclassified Bosea (in: a-proteobacteria)]|uniref:hypothetical protein n=1 Tax=unclassified Bosea (in: a-proteobacteria) TaxID=2653178 RepID=UPI000F7F283E|nr:MULTISPECIES: hypothetical protein [unclassified Bosea (in: a-proteobacteria)]